MIKGWKRSKSEKVRDWSVSWEQEEMEGWGRDGDDYMIMVIMMKKKWNVWMNEEEEEEEERMFNGRFVWRNIWMNEEEETKVMVVLVANTKKLTSLLEGYLDMQYKRK